jgi:hypothetical protein
MCRFCLEGALVRDLEELDDRQLLDAFGPPIEVLEEIDDLRLAVTNLDSGKHAIEVVMARVVEHYVLRGFDASIFEAVQQAYGHAAIAAFLDASRNAQPDLLGVALADITIYQQRKAWSRLIADRARLVSDAKDRLYDYLDSWCAVWLWPVVDDAAPTRPIVQQPARQSSGENAANLHARVIGDFAALAILCRYDPNAAVIRSIVAAQSMHQPGFSTVGLWLQRRALRHAVRHRGGLVPDIWNRDDFPEGALGQRADRPKRIRAFDPRPVIDGKADAEPVGPGVAVVDQPLELRTRQLEPGLDQELVETRARITVGQLELLVPKAANLQSATRSST